MPKRKSKKLSLSLPEALEQIIGRINDAENIYLEASEEAVSYFSEEGRYGEAVRALEVELLGIRGSLSSLIEDLGTEGGEE